MRARSVRESLSLEGCVAIVTGGAGLLGVKHAEAVAEMGGIPVLADIRGEAAVSAARKLAKTYSGPALGLQTDVTESTSVRALLKIVLETFGRVDILINNAANDPKVVSGAVHRSHSSRIEELPVDVWRSDLDIGLTGAFLCCQVIGGELARRGRGVILNIASDLAVIAPDQRIYRKPGLSEEEQPVKPVTYSVLKTALLGLTRYLATYWADRGVRVNALSPGGVENDQDAAFVARLTNLIPLRRMARRDEYKAAVVFLVSDASSYMTGANLVVDGGRSCW
jgi:NAD(P)-dependent dehydrogenase (short-subunit alcohol dehydrogenase family)